MRVEKEKLKDMVGAYDVPEFWFRLTYRRMTGLQILRMFGALYHEMVGEVDVVRMSDVELRFCRMILNMPPAWKHEILVQETWQELTELRPENRVSPTDPSEVKATWPAREQKKRIPIKPCSDCGKFTAIGCAFDDSGVRLCRNCTDRYGLGTTKTRLWEKSKTQLLSKLAGHPIGEPQIKTIRVEFSPKLPFRAPFLDTNEYGMVKIKMFAAQKWAKAITIELNSVNFFHSFPKLRQKQCLASETEGNKGQTNKGNKGHKGANDNGPKGSYKASNGTKGKRRRFKLLKKGKRQLGSLSEPLKKGRKRVKVTV